MKLLGCETGILISAFSLAAALESLGEQVQTGHLLSSLQQQLDRALQKRAREILHGFEQSYFYSCCRSSNQQEDSTFFKNGKKNV